MKKVIHHVKKHYQKHHAKLKQLDHKILELIHGMELSMILVVSIVGIASAFLVYIVDTNTSDIKKDNISVEVMNELEAIMDTQEWKNLMYELIESDDGKEFLEELLRKDDDDLLRKDDDDLLRKDDDDLLRKDDDDLLRKDDDDLLRKDDDDLLRKDDDDLLRKDDDDLL